MTVENACARLNKIPLPKHGDNKSISENGEENMGTSLFELYLIYKEFESNRSALAPDSTNSKKEFHKWFINGVAHWLHISVYKALKRIKKAIELDNLTPTDEKVKYSTSAIDTLSIFYQIEKFWQQLDWPDIEGSYTFLIKIVDDICECCAFYVDTMFSRIGNLQKVQKTSNDKRFEVTTQWCVAINNIEYIIQSLPTFVKELKVDEVIKKLQDCRGPEEMAKCDQTLKQLMTNHKEILGKKLSSLIDIAVKEMCSTLSTLLMRAAENLHEDSKLLDQLIMYLEESLKKLDTEMTETNFKSTFIVLRAKVLTTANEIIQANVRFNSAFFFFFLENQHFLHNILFCDLIFSNVVHHNFSRICVKV